MCEKISNGPFSVRFFFQTFALCAVGSIIKMLSFVNTCLLATCDYCDICHDSSQKVFLPAIACVDQEEGIICTFVMFTLARFMSPQESTITTMQRSPLRLYSVPSNTSTIVTDNENILPKKYRQMTCKLFLSFPRFCIRFRSCLRKHWCFVLIVFD